MKRGSFSFLLAIVGTVIAHSLITLSLGSLTLGTWCCFFLLNFWSTYPAKSRIKKLPLYLARKKVNHYSTHFWWIYLAWLVAFIYLTILLVCKRKVDGNLGPQSKSHDVRRPHSHTSTPLFRAHQKAHFSSSPKYYPSRALILYSPNNPSGIS